MTDPPEEPPNDLFTGVETVEDSDSIAEGIELTPEDRPRGILSQTDREYLCGLKEYAQPQTDANRRQDIRGRIVNGLKDFGLLSGFLDADEHEKIVDELGDEETEEVIASMAAFAYLSLDKETQRFEQCLERGILQATNRNKLFRSAGRATDADVSISVEYNPDVEKIYERFQNGTELTDAEVGMLVREGKLEQTEVEDLEESNGGFPGVSAGGTLESSD